MYFCLKASKFFVDLNSGPHKKWQRQYNVGQANLDGGKVSKNIEIGVTIEI